MGEPKFDERGKCGEFHTLFPMLPEKTLKFFFSILEWGPTRSGTSYIILGHTYIKNKVIYPEGFDKS